MGDVLTALPREDERRCACGTVLARDNEGELCGPCLVKAGLPGKVTPETVLLCLVADEYQTAKEIGEPLGVSDKTVHRFIAKLREAGHRIEGKQGYGYRFAHGGGRKVSAAPALPEAPPWPHVPASKAKRRRARPMAGVFPWARRPSPASTYRSRR